MTAESNRKVTVLTGAGGQFGRIVATRMLADPAIVPVFLTSDAEALRNVLAEQGAAEAAVFKVDLAESGSVRQVFERIHDEFGDVDVLINNAAVNTVAGFSDFVANSDDRRVLMSFAVNSAAPLWCIKYTLHRGRENSKRIINVLSGRALTGHVRHVDYFASKAALMNATITLARDYPRHAFCNVMSGHIDTGKGGDSPDSMWAEMRRFIFAASPPPYSEVFFMGRLAFLRHLAGHYLRHFRRAVRADVTRRSK